MELLFTTIYIYSTKKNVSILSDATYQNVDFSDELLCNLCTKKHSLMCAT